MAAAAQSRGADGPYPAAAWSQALIEIQKKLRSCLGRLAHPRAVVGWLIAEREDAELAETLLAETCAKEKIMPQQLTMHADRLSHKYLTHSAVVDH
jgi:hypothetical protein